MLQQVGIAREELTTKFKIAKFLQGLATLPFNIKFGHIRLRRIALTLSKNLRIDMVPLCTEQPMGNASGASVVF